MKAVGLVVADIGARATDAVTLAPRQATARSLGLIRCHLCALVSRPPKGAEHPVCPRCREPLHSRKPESIHRTWALVIAAAFLYIPANVYPVMTVIYFGDGSPDTIFSGVVHLLHAGEIPVALLVLFASVVVPMLKLFALAYLLVSVQRRRARGSRRRSRLYRLLEVVGRWSMLDIFMISILAALVQLGSIATIEAGPGATAFAGVVILTMLAAHSFDPRLIWDSGTDQGLA